MHSSLAVTVEGLPPGLTAVKSWTRKKFKGTAQLKKKINPTRVPIEKKESVQDGRIGLTAPHAGGTRRLLAAWDRSWSHP